MFEEFFVIKMKNKSIYLAIDEQYKGKKTKCIWTNNYDESIAFNTQNEAEDFANNYFKSFYNWEIVNRRFGI